MNFGTVNLMEQLAKGEVLLAEGAMGTELQKKGLEQGDCGEEWNVTRPEIVLDIHRSYVDLGVNLIYTNTFGATEIRLQEHRQKGRLEAIRGYGVDPDEIRETSRLINSQAVLLAKKAIGDSPCFVGGDLGPTAGDKLIMGLCTEKDILETYREQGRDLKEAGVDLLVIETIFDPQESKLAYKAVENLGLPILVSAAITRRNNLGDPATDFGVLVEQIPELYPDATILGINCGQDIDLTLEAIQRLSKCTDRPVLAKPNAGVPKVVDGQVVYSLNPNEIGEYAIRFVEAGATIVGGCCGTTPEHIAAIRASIR